MTFLKNHSCCHLNRSEVKELKLVKLRMDLIPHTSKLNKSRCVCVADCCDQSDNYAWALREHRNRLQLLWENGSSSLSRTLEILVEVRLALKELGKSFSHESPVCLTVQSYLSSKILCLAYVKLVIYLINDFVLKTWVTWEKGN